MLREGSVCLEHGVRAHKERPQDVPDIATIQRQGDNQVSDRFYAAEVSICGDDIRQAMRI